MKHSPFLKVGLIMTMFVSFLCCTHEEDSVWKDVVDKEVQSFFNIEDLHSRTNELNANLIRIVGSTLQKQNNLLEAIREYRFKYGSPMWLYSKCISTPNGLQIFVPVYNKNYPDEIKAIWHFGIYNNILYHFTRTRKPEYTLIEEYWKFDYFTIFALGKKPASGLSFEQVESRTEYDCVKVSVTVGEGEYAYTDDKGWHCWPVGEDEYLQDITTPGGGESGGGSFDSGVPIDDGIGNGGGGTGGNGSSSSGSGSASKAQKMFHNDKMTNDEWKAVENMIDSIMTDCMGENLYNALLNKLNGKTLAIEFTDASSFYFDGRISKIKLNASKMESNHLFHEMWHAYQAYKETGDSFKKAELNLEIEAHFAQYLYLSNRHKFYGSKKHKVYVDDNRHRSIAELYWYVTPKGKLRDGFTLDIVNSHVEYIVNYFHETEEYDSCKFDENRMGLSIFENLNVLTKDCQL